MSVTSEVPHDHDAERAVIGALLLDNATYDLIGGMLTPDDFYQAGHADLYRSVTDLLAAGKPADEVTIATESGDVGAPMYLAQLIEQTPTSANAIAYARIVKDKSISRKLIGIGSDIAREAKTEPPKEVIADASQRLFDLGSTQNDRRVVTAADAMRMAMKRIEYAYAHKGEVTGFRTGFDAIDGVIGGLQPTNMYVIGARPSMGKTALLLDMLKRASMRHGHRCALFELEMSTEQLAMRMIANESRVDLQRLNMGMIGETDWARLARGASEISAAPLHFDDTAGTTLGDLRRSIRRIIATHGKVDIVAIDYLQLMTAEKRSDNREREISEFSRGCKKIAKDFNVAVIALSQLNRDCEKRQDKRPMMADLRESGAIEQDADAIAFLYRDEVYNEDTDQRGIAEVIFAKNRHGPIGTVKLHWDKERQRFDSLEERR